ncbi:MAG: phosphatase PAP2 family protein [Candidatus Micrarchaeota archaeon]|nr:phosphatase PAP2 family protein [Candidatus Micrarchaeota archaeon]
MDILTAINNVAFQYAGGIASNGLTVAMGYFAESYYVVLAAIALFLFVKKDKNVFTFAAATVVLFIISDVLKTLVQEPRPCQVETLSWLNGVCESGFGFPSNHATVLTGIALFVKGYRYLNVLYIIWLLIVLFGRVYLGAHYLSDVIAGIAISLVVAGIIYRYREQINSFAIKALKPIFGRYWAK